MRGPSRHPFQDINRLRGRLRRLLDDTFPLPVSAAGLAGRWTPPTDIVAENERVLVTLEVCGMTREDIEVSLRGNVLSVSGRRSRPAEDMEATFLSAERPAGPFSRSFTLAWPPRSYAAALSDGVLTITLER